MPTVETNGIETYYEGYGEGVPVVCPHGGNSDHQLLAEQLEPLAEDARVVVYDLRGHGKTGGSDDETYSMDLYAEDLTALTDELGLDAPVVCGLSLGGMIGYTVAATRPEELSGLVTLGGPTPQTFSLGERLLRAEVARLMTPVMGNERVMAAYGWVMDRVFRDSTTVDMEDRERIRAAHHCDPPEMDSTERAKVMRGVQGYIGSSLDWQTVDVPILAMYGEAEPFVERHARYVRERVGTCRVEEIPDASHNSHVDNAEFIVDRIRGFLSDVPG